MVFDFDLGDESDERSLRAWQEERGKAGRSGGECTIGAGGEGSGVESGVPTGSLYYWDLH